MPKTTKAPEKDQKAQEAPVQVNATEDKPEPEKGAPEAQDAPEAPVQGKPDEEGVKFWHRRRAETAAGPVWFDNPEDAPAGATIGESSYVRIAYPRGSTKILEIHGSKRINDRHIVAYLIMKNKAPGRAGMGKGKSKSGRLLYDPEEVVAKGYMTKEELERCAVHNEPPEWYRPPMEPMPNVRAMNEVNLDRLAREKGIAKYNPEWNIWEKQTYLDQWFRSQQ